MSIVIVNILYDFFKSNSFRSEEEVRILLVAPMNGEYQTEHIKFNIRQGFISPALEIVGTELVDSISRIITGPYNSDELSVLGLQEYFKCRDINNIEVKSSSNAVRF